MSLPSFRRAALAATACATGFLVVGSPSPAAQADFNEIGKSVAIMLQNAHFAKLPFEDETTSQRFLDDYLKQLDPGKVYFIQADVTRFKEAYGANLFKLLVQAKVVDAANDIYDTYRQRVASRGEMAKKFLKEEIDFTAEESIARVRKDAPWPADEAEAEKQLRLELKDSVLTEMVLRELQAKLAKDQGKPDPTRSELPAREKIALRYERFLHTVRDARPEDISGGLLGAVARSHDPHTDYMIASEAGRFNDAMRNELVGIGAELKPEDDGSTRIMGIMIGGPADREGSLQLRDSIVAVDTDNSGSFTDVRFMDKDRVVDLIRGKAGSTVRLQVQPASAAPGELKIVTIPRGKVEIKGTQASAGMMEVKTPEGKLRRLGWITLPAFYSDFSGGQTRCSLDVERFLTRLVDEKIDGLILDLRNNGGGSLEEVRRMTGFFTGNGPVVQEKNTLGQIKVSDSDKRDAIYGGPMVVLVNKASASASEIIAGALQDYHRAVIVGDSSTFGKGTVQEPMDVAKLLPFFSAREGAGMLKLTIRKFYRPSGSSTQLDGVLSDIVLPGPGGGLEIGERFLDRPFPHDRIAPAAGLKPLDQGKLFLAKLRELSSKRVQGDKEFAFYAEEGKRGTEQREKNQTTLNLEKRRKEIFDLDARYDVLNTDRRDRFKVTESEDAKLLKLTKLTLDDLAKGAGFHTYDPSKEKEEYIRRAKDPIAELNETPEWPSGLDPIKREGLRILDDLVDLTEKAEIAGVTPPKDPAIR